MYIHTEQSQIRQKHIKKEKKWNIILNLQTLYFSNIVH